VDINFYRLMDFAPEPVPSKNILPEWYQQQPGYHEGEPTVKRCMPIFDSMTMGYMLLAPCNISVESSKDKLAIASDEDVLSTHSFEQYSEYPIDAGMHQELLRIHPGWGIKTSPGVSTIFLAPTHRETHLFPLSAVVDTDNFFADGYLSFFVKKNSSFVINKGDPLMQLFPFQRSEYKMNLLSIEDGLKERKRLDDIIEPDGMHVSGTYKKQFMVKKNFK